jgi:hypothetical protein
MYSKTGQLSGYDLKQITIYGVYVIVAMLVLYPSQITTFLTNHWLSQEAVTGIVAFTLYVLKRFLKDNSMEDPLNIMDGAMEWDVSEDDMILEGENIMLENLAKSPIADNIRISYSQYANPKTKSACTLFSPLWVISSIFNKRLTQEEIMECRDYAEKNFWYKVGKGMYFETGVRCVVKRWNEKFPTMQVMYFKSNLGTKEIQMVLDKGYGVCGWYKGNAEYNKDRMDFTLDGTEFGETTYWHATSYHILDWIKYCYDSMPSMLRYIFGHDPAVISGRYRSCYVILPIVVAPITTRWKLYAIRERLKAKREAKLLERK